MQLQRASQIVGVEYSNFIHGTAAGRINCHRSILENNNTVVSDNSADYGPARLASARGQGAKTTPETFRMPGAFNAAG